MELSKSEEQLMEYLWKKKHAFMRELIGAYPDPKPATTTVATLLKRMIDKGYVGYKKYGNSREYFPTVKKSEYFSRHIHQLINKFFNNSASQFASFFTEETEMTKKELKQLRDIIDQQIKNK